MSKSKENGGSYVRQFNGSESAPARKTEYGEGIRTIVDKSESDLIMVKNDEGSRGTTNHQGGQIPVRKIRMRNGIEITFGKPRSESKFDDVANFEISGMKFTIGKPRPKSTD